MSSFHRAFAVVVFSFSACAEPQKDSANVPDNGQTYRDAVAILCNVDEVIALGEPADVLEAAERRHEYLQSHVKHPDGIYFYTLFRMQGPKEQAAALRQEATEVKLVSCPRAGMLEAEASE